MNPDKSDYRIRVVEKDLVIPTTGNNPRGKNRFSKIVNVGAGSLAQTSGVPDS